MVQFCLETYNLNIDMKESIFSFIWAGICALLSVLLLVYLDSKLNFSDDYFFPTIVDAIHGWGLSVRKVLFFSLYLLYWLTGIHKLFGNGILALIGWVTLLIIIAVVIVAGYWFVTWLATFI